MSTYTFQIDKSKSEGCLALKIDGLTSLRTPQISDKDKDAFAFLSKFPNEQQSNSVLIKIPYTQTLAVLKLLAATGKLFFKEKKLVSDLFGKSKFHVVIEDKLKVAGKILFRETEIDLIECDFVCPGPPHWFIKGVSLKLLDCEFSWKTFKKLADPYHSWSSDEIQDLAEDEDLTVLFEGSAKEELDVQKDPFPILILKDNSGAFADLWMDYGVGNKIEYRDNGPAKFKRQLAAERNWEKDLLETGFQKKEMATSKYYCPLDKVAKSLAFLLELGWYIQDAKGNKVVKQSDAVLQMESRSQKIFLKGKIKFNEFEANLEDVAGAFNRKERFVQLGSGVVGLLPTTWEGTGLNSAFEEGEIVSEGISFSKNNLGTISKLFHSGNKIQMDAELAALQEQLKDFKEIKHCEAGKSFIGNLRPYQQQGLNWLAFLYEYGFSGLLADDMGLGKTVQVIAFLSQLETNRPILIVVPTSLIFNWQREIDRFLPGQIITLYHGISRVLTKDTKGIIITSYSTLRMDYLKFIDIEFECILLDEAQAIKNSETQVARAVYSLNARYRLAITGTPIENHMKELWAQFRFLMPEFLGDEAAFNTEIMASTSDPRFMQKIRRQIKPFILRRKKEEVAKDLPEKIEQTVWVEMSLAQRQIYDDFLAGVKGNLFKKIEIDGTSKHRMEIFEAILRLRQICCHPLLIAGQLSDKHIFESSKLDALLEDISTVQAEGKKALVYTQFTSMLGIIGKVLNERGWKFAYLDGETKNREKVVDQFQNDPDTQIFLISLKAGGVGLNLTAADYVFLYDPWWNEAAEDQAINRAHRMGRKDTVIAKRYIAIETIEEKMMKLKSLKKSLFNDLLDQGDLGGQSLSMEDLSFLLA